MSVPRPAMLVATVMARRRPAPALVGGDRDGATPPRLRDDAGLLLVELRVQHVVRDPPLGELLGQVLRALDTGGADQDRLALLVALDHVVDDGDVLGLFGLV